MDTSLFIVWNGNHGNFNTAWWKYYFQNNQRFDMLNCESETLPFNPAWSGESYSVIRVYKSYDAWFFNSSQ